MGNNCEYEKGVISVLLMGIEARWWWNLIENGKVILILINITWIDKMDNELLRFWINFRVII